MTDFDKQRTIRPWLIASVVLVFIGAIYSILWIALAMSVQEQSVMWIKEQSNHGLNLRYEKLVASGYPFAIHLEVTSPALSVSKNAFSLDWQGESLKVTTRLWDKNRYRIEVSGEQILVFGKAKEGQKFTGDVEQALAEFVLFKGELTIVNIGLTEVQLINYNAASEVIGIPRAELLVKKLEKPDVDVHAASWSLSASTENLILPWFRFSPLGTKLSLITENPLNWENEGDNLVRSLENWRDNGGTAELKTLKIGHGPLKVHTEGTLALDNKLQPIGALTAKLEGFYQTIDALKALGVVTARNAITAKVLIGVLSRAPVDGGPPVLNLSITAQNQNLYIGPIRLLKLPKVNWH